MTSVLEAALELHAAGYSVLPIRPDGTKAPAIPWKPFTQERATEDQVRAWFTGTDHGLAVIQGAISGNAELTELEGRAAHQLASLRDLAHDTGLGTLWDTITGGWTEMSPSGGFHFHYRLDTPVPGNTKIARGADKQVLAETRGENGYVVVAPTPGTHHTTGKPWTRVIGSPATAPLLSLEDRDAFHALLRTLDEAPQRDKAPENKPGNIPALPRDPADGITPGDDYENKTDWSQILTPAGWAHVTTRGQTRYWRRPGKTEGFSATTGHANDRDRLYVFTSSTDFEQEVPYTKLGAYAVLHHGGDHSAAATELHRQGYGQRPRETTLRLVRNTPDPLFEGLPTNGANALNPAPQHLPTPTPDTITEHRMTLTDVGNAQLLVAKHGHHIRYIARRGEWLTWDGSRWAFDDIGTINEHAKNTILDINTEGDQAADKHRTRSLSRRAIEAMVALARTDPNIAVVPQQLDAHPYHLCTPGGVVDLRTGRLATPNPADLHTRATSVTPNPDCPTPRWNKFLEQTFAGRDDLTEFVQRLAGYSSLGVVTRHVLPFLLGPGGNGKSVLLDVMRAILGDYAATTPAKFLMAGVNQHETEVARLSGLRLVISSEVNEEDRFDEAKVKLLTGGDALTARFMHQNHFTFTPTHTLWLMGNHQPRVSSGGDSFWRRLRLVPFDHTVPDGQRIDGLDKILIDEEGPGILAWIINGATKALQSGLAEPDIVMAATQAYASEEDHLARFVEDRIHLGGGSAARENTASVRRAYESWCRDEGERVISPQGFGRELRTRFDVGQAKSNGMRFYTGMTLLADETEPDQPEEWWQK